MPVKGGYFSRNRVVERCREEKRMEAKDTVMSDEQLINARILAYARLGLPVTDIVRYADIEYRSVAEEQAEVSFKAGMKTVVEWIEKHTSEDVYFKSFNNITEWHAQLKEWGPQFLVSGERKPSQQACQPKDKDEN